MNMSWYDDWWYDKDLNVAIFQTSAILEPSRIFNKYCRKITNTIKRFKCFVTANSIICTFTVHEHLWNIIIIIMRHNYTEMIKSEKFVKACSWVPAIKIIFYYICKVFTWKINYFIGSYADSNAFTNHNAFPKDSYW